QMMDESNRLWRRIHYLLRGTLGLCFLWFAPSFLVAQSFDLRQFIKDHQSKRSDSLVTLSALDALSQASNPESHITWYEGSYWASDDHVLKLYHFTGEGCGAYCNPVYQSVASIHISSGDSPSFSEVEDIHFDIERIITLESKKLYLILGRHRGRARSVESVWGQTAILCAIEYGFDIVWKFQATTSNLVDIDSPMSEIRYHEASKTISYTYDGYDEQDDYQVYRIRGVWKFNGASFEEIKRQRTPIADTGNQKD
ncbi:MAG: hypothetical protein AAFR59_18195, partial [Bacteroidota bacterium]